MRLLPTLLLAFGLAACDSGASDPPETLPALPAPQVDARPPTPAPPAWLVGSIAVVAEQPDGAAVALLDVTGRSQAGLLEPRFDAIDDLAWSPDGSRLVVAARREANWDLWSLDPGDAAAAPLRLTDHPGYDGGPAFSPDGTRIAYERYDEDGFGIHWLSLVESAAESGVTGLPATAATRGVPATQRLSPLDERAMDPVWSPEGDAVLWAGWRYEDGAAGLFATSLDEVSTTRVLVPPAPERHDVDLRHPAFAPGGEQLAWLALRHGTGQVTRGRWPAQPPTGTGDPIDEPEAGDGPGSAATGRLSPSGGALTASATAFAWSPLAAADEIGARDRATDGSWQDRGGAIAFLSPGRRNVRLELRAIDGRERHALATLPESTRVLAWTAAPLPANLAPWEPDVTEASGFASGAGSSFGGRRSSDDTPFGGPERPGLVRLDIEAPGARIHAGLADDFAALRARVRTETGRDFLGTVSDMWRSLGFYSKGSAFFSWHKTGRAFDTTQELYGPGGRRDMVLVREDLAGRTYWRMYLRAGAQDGSVGRPMREPGWRFAVASDSELVRREGGERSLAVTGGWFVDFTDHAADHGWHRIPANRRAGFDWRENWAAIEFWHYERRDGYSWNEAARQVYDDATLAAELDREQLRERGIATWRLGALGLPRR